MTEKNHMIKKNGTVEEEKVPGTLDRIDSGQTEDILENFNEFKEYLHKRIEVGKNIGLNEEQLAVTAEKIAEYLAENVEPKNREEKLLKELWKAGNKEERHKFAHLLVKFAKEDHYQ